MKVQDIEDWLFNENTRLQKRYEESSSYGERYSLQGSQLTIAKLIKYIKLNKKKVL